MSIYDDQFNEDPKTPPEPAAADPTQLAASPPEPIIEAKVADAGDEPESPPRRRGCGCGSCLLALMATSLICIVLCGIGGYLGFKNAPNWAHDAIVSAVNDSDLDAEAKQEITADMDRLLAEYKAGNVSGERINSALQELSKSPVTVLLMAYATVQNYIEPSGLSDEEKAAAKLVFQRVARGVFDRTIDTDDLEKAMDYVSKKDFNGNRQIKTRVSDKELRALVKECARVADEADIPNEPYEVDVAAEVRRIVDRALGLPVEQDLSDTSEGQSSGEAMPDDVADPNASSIPNH